MKRAVSLFLFAVILLTGISPLAYARAAADGGETFKSFVATDIHHFVTDEVPVVDGKPFFYDNLGLTPTLAPAILTEFLRQAAESDADYVFLTGDLADIPDIKQAKAVAKKLASFERSSGKKVFVINGNHDTDYTDSRSPGTVGLKEFKSIYARFGYDEALCTDSASCSYTADLKNGYRLIAIDALDRPGTGGATINRALAKWIRAQAVRARRDGKKLVALMHHPLMNHFTMMSTLLPVFVVSNSKEACRLFARCGIQTVFTGHFHQNDIAVYRGFRDVYDIETTSLSCYPNAYRTVVFRPNAVDISTVPIAKIDVSSLPAGYSEAQKAYIASDLEGYAYDCFREDSIATILGYLNAEKLAGKLGITDPTLKRTLDKLLAAFAECFSLPLYGEKNSMEALSRQIGLSLPESEYETVNDAAAALVAAQLAGDEHFDSRSPLVRILLFSTLSVLCREGRRTVGVDRLLEAIRRSSLVSRNPQLSRLFANLSAALLLRGCVLDSMLLPTEPLLIGLTVDRCPGDNNVTLRLR